MFCTPNRARAHTSTSKTDDRKKRNVRSVGAGGVLTSALSSSLGTLSVVSLSVHERETQGRHSCPQTVPRLGRCLENVSAPLFPEAKWVPDLPIPVPFLRSNTDRGRCQSDHGPSDTIASRGPGDVCPRPPLPRVGCCREAPSCCLLPMPAALPARPVLTTASPQPHTVRSPSPCQSAH